MHVISNAHFEAPPATQSVERVEHTTPRVPREEQLRPWLRYTARLLRSSGESGAAADESPWNQVVSGRWSPIDSFEHDEVLYVIAQRVPADLEVGKALAQRKHALLSMAADGAPHKCISYEMGISQATVSQLLAKLRKILNADSPAAFARLLWVLRSVGSEQSAGFTGFWTVDRQDYATFSIRTQTASLTALTRSERLVFQSVLAGYTTEEIASQRSASPRTLANQLASIFRKLGVGSRVELLARYAHCYREIYPETGSARRNLNPAGV